MTNLSEKLKSMRDLTSTNFVRPDLNKAKGFVKALWSTPHAQDYLRITRNLSEDTIRHFRLGYDETKDAISIPIFKRGELVNIRYRLINPREGQSKYTQERGAEVWIFNEDGVSLGQKKGRLIITEGEFDMMSAWQAGFREIVSPASGKDSYGVWLEMIDAIPNVVIAYDNDKPGKTASYKLADRVGIDKCSELVYPDGYKDANDFFKEKTNEDFLALIKQSRPYYKYKYQGVNDIIESIRQNDDSTTKLDMVPHVEFEDDFLAMVSGDSGVGKTGYVLNILSELADKKIPTLIMPFERGIKSVGRRFLQVRHDKTKNDMEMFSQQDWDRLIIDAAEMPVYFSVPNVEEFKDIVRRAKRLFNIQFCIIDHLDYFIDGSDRFAKQADMIKEIKTLAQETQVRFLVVHHIGKGDMNGVKRKPTKHDLKGSSDLYQIPEAVLLLYEPEDGYIEVIVDKNKGPEGSEYFKLKKATGKMVKDGSYNPQKTSDEVAEEMEKFVNS